MATRTKVNFRFIPAGAGNTSHEVMKVRGRSVYPRWRGEHTSNTTVSASATGLSPLARGTHSAEFQTAYFRRFIPAGAGNTSCALVPRSHQAVYPRWRGEHMMSGSGIRWSYGLSPLARGTLCPAETRRRRSRFIPAGAGNTRHRRHPSKHRSVYPRWRGEHTTAGQASVNLAGLSPLARGTHMSFGMVSDLMRFIPAGAGNT